eukprot:6979045-Pyramimonas_sp.AAC.1
MPISNVPSRALRSWRRTFVAGGGVARIRAPGRGSADPGQSRPGLARPCKILQCPARSCTQARFNAREPARSCRILHPNT